MTASTAERARGYSRRQLLYGAGASAAASVLHAQPASAMPAVGGAPSGRLVTVFLRGGMDHLSAVFPLDDSDLAAARPTIAVSGGLELAEGFGLHPAMPRLHDRFSAGHLAPVVAAGNPAGDRSHFVAQDLVALGGVEYGADARGWLGRHLAATETPEDERPLRAVTVGGNVDRSLAGYRALGLSSIQQFGLGPLADAWELEAVIRASLADGAPGSLIGHQALRATAAVSGLPGSTAEDEDVRTFEDVATLLDEGRDAELGVEVVTVDLGGWDTHDGMGTTEDGEMRSLLAHLDDVLGGFLDDLDRRGIDDVRTVVQTEFGRRVRENGSGGTDHGWGSTMFVLGPGLAATPNVHGTWSGLAADVLGKRGDIPVTTDFRDVLAEVAAAALGVEPAVAFPHHERTPIGLFI